MMEFLIVVGPPGVQVLLSPSQTVVPTVNVTVDSGPGCIVTSGSGGGLVLIKLP